MHSLWEIPVPVCDADPAPLPVPNTTTIEQLYGGKHGTGIVRNTAYVETTPCGFPEMDERMNSEVDERMNG